MSSPVSIGNGVGKTENLIVVGIVVLKHTINEDIVFDDLSIIIDLDFALPLNDDRLRMNQGLIGTKLLNKFHNSPSVEKGLRLSRFGSDVFEMNS